MSCRIWVDLETTGLDPHQGHVLELAVVATDPTAPEYREVAAQSWVIGADWLCGRAWTDVLDPAVYAMHNASGLLVESGLGGNATLAEAEADLVRFLKYFGNPAPGREPIAGSSPQFDAAWLAVHMPTARKYFGHRVFCASSMKRFALDHGCVWPDSSEGSGGAAHRALPDIRSSIQTARTVARLLAAR